MDLRILPPRMGRKKLPEVRGSVSFRLLPSIEERLIAVTAAHQAKSKSAMAERLLVDALEIAESGGDVRELISAWKRLATRDRDVLLNMARSFEMTKADPPPNSAFLSDYTGPDFVEMDDDDMEGTRRKDDEDRELEKGDIKRALEQKPKGKPKNPKDT